MEPASMRDGAFAFSSKWKDQVRALPETGMGHTVVRIALNDGRVFEQAVIDSGVLSRVRSLANIPFQEQDIAAIVPTHERWNWKETP